MPISNKKTKDKKNVTVWATKADWHKEKDL